VEKHLLDERIGYWRLDGHTSEARREAMMRAFQDPAINRQRVFLLNSQAGGVSITLDAADEMHQLDRMYPPEANTQLYGRIFRRGRVHEVFYYLYESMGTIDEQITAKTEAGHEAQLKVLDGRRGLEYVRTLATYNPEAVK
jgi:SNF2 family DNA or RNA helicase